MKFFLMKKSLKNKIYVYGIIHKILFRKNLIKNCGYRV